MFIFLRIFKKIAIVNLLFFSIFSFSSSVCWGADTEQEKKIQGMDLINEKAAQQYPHSAVLSIECDFGKFQSSGTGFLIAPNFALTAAHVVFSQGASANKITCYIGRHGKTHKTAIKVKSYVFPVEYRDLLLEHIKLKKTIEGIETIIKDKQKGEKNQKLESRLREIKDIERNLDTILGDKDYALLYWENAAGDPPLTLREGDAFIMASSLKDLLDKKVKKKEKPQHALKFCGYPEAEEDGHFYPYEGDAIIAKQRYSNFNILLFDTSCYPGMSGSPVRYQSGDNDWRAIAILISEVREERGNFLFSKAYRLTEDKLTRVETWKKIIAGGNVSFQDKRGLVNGGLIFNCS
jgi:V8-like Glu-specific endopeptidase